MTALFLFLTRTTLKRNNPRLGSGRLRLVYIYIYTHLKFARVEPTQECGHVLNVYSELKYP